ncbi:YcaO-like family protein [Salinarchaeum chitinilyticum]
MTVRLVGQGPAIDAVAAALGDVDVRVERGGVDGLTDASLGVVCATAGDGVFERANRLLADGGATADDGAGGRWIAIEVGGIGGVPIEGIDAAITGFAPGGPCYHCLQQRVAANGPEPADAASADRSAVRMAGAVAGREVVRALAGKDRLSGRVIEIPHAERELLPVPGCECADSGESSDDRDAAGGSVPRTFEDRPLEETVARMDRAIDPRVGIVSEIGEAESFPAPYYLATLADTTGFSDGDAPRQAAGIADDWNAALAKGVGEALERYGGAIYREDAFRRAAPTSLDGAVAPAAFAGAGEDAPDGEAERSIPWVRGEALATGDEIGRNGEDGDAWLPAAAVHFPGPEPRVVPSITTGLGLESSGVGALLAGLTESIERDATMLAWYSTFEPLGLTVDDEAFDRLAKRAKSEGLDVTPLLVTQDVDVPVVAVAVHREDPWPRFAVGSAAALDPTAAATGALEEAIQNWMELRSIGPEAAADRQDAIGHFADFPDSAREFVDVDPTVAASDVGPADPSEGEAALTALLEALGDAGMEAYAARLTTRDLEQLGFEAVRVLVPDAQPLFTGTARFGERAERVPESLGYESRLDREHHPYP